ncbi:MAG: hypothetical protein IPM84_25965 [Anaerolineae bacterium]|nr:hypothetical protein [Anaerolineae bacterium]
MAAKEALRRLQAGDAHMAVHPNCGTNFVTSGMLAGLAAWAVTVLSTQGERKRSAWEALPTAFTAATLALFVAQPLGHTLQEFVTTSPGARRAPGPGDAAPTGRRAGAFGGA